VSAVTLAWLAAKVGTLKIMVRHYQMKMHLAQTQLDHF
jgi:hypothetical protein